MTNNKLERAMKELQYQIAIFDEEFTRKENLINELKRENENLCNMVYKKKKTIDDVLGKYKQTNPNFYECYKDCEPIENINGSVIYGTWNGYCLTEYGSEKKWYTSKGIRGMCKGRFAIIDGEPLELAR